MIPRHGSHQASVQQAALHLIDVKTNSVVPAPKGAIYIAISYVWGGAQLLAKFPQVVIDSMLLVEELGYCHLWVDQYVRKQDGVLGARSSRADTQGGARHKCINQEKHRGKTREDRQHVPCTRERRCNADSCLGKRFGLRSSRCKHTVVALTAAYCFTPKLPSETSMFCA